MLGINNHDRDVVALTYVYPVISRRAGGVSLGINLNPNNMCNWQCVYCQVPNLKKGVAPTIDLSQLETELDGFLHELLHGDFMVKQVPEGCRKLCDLAISGNGEPTTCPNFLEVVTLITSLMQKHGLNLPLRLISNGSSVHKSQVQAGLALMDKQQGEVWFKVDAISETITKQINGVSLSAAWQAKQLILTANTCSTWIQTCVLTEQSQHADFAAAYLSWLADIIPQCEQLQGVLLYGLARPSMQDKGELLTSASDDWMQSFAQKIESLGLSVKVS